MDNEGFFTWTGIGKRSLAGHGMCCDGGYCHLPGGYVSAILRGMTVSAAESGAALFISFVSNRHVHGVGSVLDYAAMHPCLVWARV